MLAPATSRVRLAPTSPLTWEEGGCVVQRKPSSGPARVYWRHTAAEGGDVNRSAGGSEPILVLDTGGHIGRVMTVLFTPDGKQLISVSHDKTIRTWDVITGTPLRVLRPPIGPGPQGMLYAEALSPMVEPCATGGNCQWSGKSIFISSTWTPVTSRGCSLGIPAPLPLWPSLPTGTLCLGQLGPHRPDLEPDRRAVRAGAERA